MINIVCEADAKTSREPDRMSGAPFAALAAWSSHSHLFGAVGVDALVESAAALGYQHLALTDRNNLGGIPRFLQLAEEAGLHPLVGVEVTDRQSAVVALARDTTGYANGT